LSGAEIFTKGALIEAREGLQISELRTGYGHPEVALNAALRSLTGSMEATGRVPVLAGAGIPLLGPVPREISLRHVATRYYNGGLVQSGYNIGVKESSQ
jgi:hypothetical protein